MRPEDSATENGRASFRRGLGRQFVEMRQVIGALGFEAERARGHQRPDLRHQQHREIPQVLPATQRELGRAR
jgi:hypothetical protein